MWQQSGIRCLQGASAGSLASAGETKGRIIPVFWRLLVWGTLSGAPLSLTHTHNHFSSYPLSLSLLSSLPLSLCTYLCLVPSSTHTINRLSVKSLPFVHSHKSQKNALGLVTKRGLCVWNNYEESYVSCNGERTIQKLRMSPRPPTYWSASPSCGNTSHCL